MEPLVRLEEEEQLTPATWEEALFAVSDKVRKASVFCQTVLNGELCACAISIAFQSASSWKKSHLPLNQVVQKQRPVHSAIRPKSKFKGQSAYYDERHLCQHCDEIPRVHALVATQ